MKLRTTKNKPRVLAIGDIHGCLAALQLLERNVAFRQEDTVVTVGDYIDRGPDSKGVIDFLVELRMRTQLVTLRGNHEVMMLMARSKGLEFFEAWLSAGGESTMLSFDAENLDQVPDSCWDFLETTSPYHETERHFFVHANARALVPLELQSENVLFWERFTGKEPPHCSGKTMICGHTPQHSGEPANIGHAVCIDTWAYGRGWLTCLDVNTGEYWQARQSGETRKGRLAPP